MIIFYGSWLRLPLSTRQLIASQFNIGKTKPTHVVGNEVVDDGYEVKNIEAQLNVEALQAYTGSTESDLGILWGQMVDKIEGRTPVQEPWKAPSTEVIKKAVEGIAFIENVVLKESPKKEPNIEQIKAVHEAITDVVAKKRGRPAKAK